MTCPVDLLVARMYAYDWRPDGPGRFAHPGGWQIEYVPAAATAAGPDGYRATTYVPHWRIYQPDGSDGGALHEPAGMLRAIEEIEMHHRLLRWTEEADARPDR